METNQKENLIVKKEIDESIKDHLTFRLKWQDDDLIEENEHGKNVYDYNKSCS